MADKHEGAPAPAAGPWHLPLIGIFLATLLVFGLGVRFEINNRADDDRALALYRARSLPDGLTTNQVAGKEERFAAYPDVADDRCYRSVVHDRADLCAQWRAAYAAERSAFWSMWSFWGGLAGIVGLFWTLYYSRAAVFAARESSDDAARALLIAERNADAAVQQVEHARIASKRQLRAYVGVSAITVQRRAIGADSIVTVVMDNYGETPAELIRVKISATWISNGRHTKLLELNHETFHELYRGLKMNMPYQASDPVFSGKGRERYAVSGAITYLDVFGDKNVQDFRFSLEADEWDHNIKEVSLKGDPTRLKNEKIVS